MRIVLTGSMQSMIVDGIVFRVVYEDADMLAETGLTVEAYVEYACADLLLEPDEIEDILWCVLRKIEGKSTDIDDYLDEKYADEADREITKPNKEI